MRIRRLIITHISTVAVLAVAVAFGVCQSDSTIGHGQEIGRSTGGVRTVAGGILNRKAVEKPNPIYPQQARAARVSGVVLVHILVNQGGIVEKATAISGHPLLRNAAVEAAYRARFAPTRISGKPVKVSGTMLYRFVRSRDI